MSEPKCPECGVNGIEKIVSRPSKEKSRENTTWFFIAYCDDCGHVYGIFTKHIFSKSGTQLIVERG
jgi:uncharacterized Zn finger protein